MTAVELQALPLSRAALLLRSQRHTTQPLFLSLWTPCSSVIEQLRFASKEFDKLYCRGTEWRVGTGGTAGGAGCRVRGVAEEAVVLEVTVKGGALGAGN